MKFLDFDNFKNSNFKGWTPLLLLVSLATTLGTAIPVGFMLGVMNTPAQYIKAWSNEVIAENYNIHLTQDESDILLFCAVSLFLFGGIVGSPFGAYLSDRYGRKGCLFISAALLTLSGILFHLCQYANSVEMLLLGRFLGGIAAALIYTAHPMYLLEIAPAELRATLGVFTAVGVTVGICVGQIISLEMVLGSENCWHYALGFHVWLVVLGFLPYHWYPESPRYLFSVRKDVNQARIQLLRLRGNDNSAVEAVKSEIFEMELAAKVDDVKHGFCSTLKNPDLFLPMFLTCSFQICQQLSGINAIFFYSVQIFNKAGFSTENASWMNLGAGALNAVMSCFGPWLMMRFNRRPLMLFSCICCFFSHIGLAFALNYIDAANWLPIACIMFMCSFICLYQLGLGPIPYFIGAELFEIGPRSVAMAMGSLFSWCGNFLIGMCFPLVEKVLGSYVFLLCSVVCLYAAIVTHRYLPETRHRNPVDLKPIMKNGLRTKINS